MTDTSYARNTRYPSPIEQGSKIAVCALSSGIGPEHVARFDAVIAGWRALGLTVIVGATVKPNHKGASATAQQRADELQRFLLDDSIDAIAPPWGGELAMEILPLLDFQALSHAKPKWLFGFSDISTIAVALNVKLHWASAHCSNMMDLIHTASEPLVANTLRHLSTPSGRDFTQNASSCFSKRWPDIVNDPMAEIQGDTQTQWQWLVAPENGLTMKGRLIGGCWDTLHLLQGSEYFRLETLAKRYEEPILLYLENAEMTPAQLSRVVLSMIFGGAFSYLGGVILGRSYPEDPQDPASLNYLDVLNRHVVGLGIPVLYDVDIGHAPPNLTLINGALAEIGFVSQQTPARGFVRQWLV